MIEYRDIPGLPGYKAGSDGHIYSEKVWRRAGRGPRLARMAESVQNYGHLRVTMRHQGRSFHRHIHRLVLEAFVGPCPAGMICCHNDGDQTNNRPENLRWDTVAANGADAARHGVHAGDRNGRAKVRSADLETIRRLREAGTKIKDIGLRYGVTDSTISKCLKGNTWRRVAIDG